LIEPCILAGSRPGDVVLDPFGGTATVVRVARRLNREGIACDLNPQYLALAEDRITEVQPSLLHVGA
jgi:DNA modification methylase